MAKYASVLFKSLFATLDKDGAYGGPDDGYDDNGEWNGLDGAGDDDGDGLDGGGGASGVYGPGLLSSPGGSEANWPVVTAQIASKNHQLPEILFQIDRNTFAHIIMAYSWLPNQMISLILIFGCLCRSSTFRYPDFQEI